MANQKVTTKTKTTKTPASDRDLTMEFAREYLTLSPHNRRAVEVSVVMLSEGASPEMTKTVILKLADMWRPLDDHEAEAVR